jgi:hypothetical protein
MAERRRSACVSVAICRSWLALKWREATRWVPSRISLISVAQRFERLQQTEDNLANPSLRRLSLLDASRTRSATNEADSSRNGLTWSRDRDAPRAYRWSVSSRMRESVSVGGALCFCSPANTRKWVSLPNAERTPPIKTDQ